MLSRFVNLIGLVLSVLTAVVIIYWGLNISDLKVEKLPVIKALEGDIRMKPSKDLLDESSRELSVNSLISGNPSSEVEKDITLAPLKDSLSTEESVVTIEPLNESLDLSEAIADALKQVLNEENISEGVNKNSEFKIIFNEAENKVEVEDFYMQLLLSFNDKLSEIPHEIEAIQIDGINYYRLVLKGLESKSIAKELRSFFLKNGIDSEISIK